MRTCLLFTLLSGLFFTSGCFVTDVALPRNSEYRLSNLPTQAHQQPIEVFFPGEPLPTDSYIKVQLLTARANTFRNNAAAIANLQREAQMIGADAILIFATATPAAPTNFDGSVSVPLFQVSNENSYDAVAIKYTKNLNYLTGFIRQKRFFEADSTGQWNLVDSALVASNGSINYLQRRTNWVKLVECFDYNAILPALEPEANLSWHLGSVPSLQSTQWFVPATRSLINYRYRLERTASTQQLRRIERRPASSFGPKDICYLWYDKSGRLTAADFGMKSWGRNYRAVYEYDPSGTRLVAVTYFQTHKKQPERAVLRVVHDYYTPADIEKIAAGK
jgi:hypothetical protein